MKIILYILLVFFCWFILVLVILRFTPDNKIVLITKFFEKVLPELPFKHLKKMISNNPSDSD